MYEWLNDEISRIRTRRFHMVDGPASTERRRSIVSCDTPLPPSYKEFILRFGNAALYHHDTFYYITILSTPVTSVTDSGERYLQFGRTWTSNAFFKNDLLSEGQESPVFEQFTNRFCRTADSFEMWLKAKSDSARKRFKKHEWNAIVKGPAPFTAEESERAKARRLFKWRIIGISTNDDLCFEIHNGSSMTLPYLSIGIRGNLRPPKHGPLTGGVFIPVSTISPGMTKVIEVDCYKKFISPVDTEAFELADPEPEDREEYWEFRDFPKLTS
jgi:hypothetical protein